MKPPFRDRRGAAPPLNKTFLPGQFKCDSTDSVERNRIMQLLIIRRCYEFLISTILYLKNFFLFLYKPS